jgi:hypothetical protein
MENISQDNKVEQEVKIDEHGLLSDEEVVLRRVLNFFIFYLFINLIFRSYLFL